MMLSAPEFSSSVLLFNHLHAVGYYSLQKIFSRVHARLMDCIFVTSVFKIRINSRILRNF